MKVLSSVLSFFLLLCTVCLCAEIPKKGIDVIKKKEGYDVTIENLSLKQAIEELSGIVPFELKGTITSDELLTVSFKDASLEEILKRLLRGYNYALLKTEGKNPMLLIMGKAERGKYVETKPVAEGKKEAPSPTTQPQPNLSPNERASPSQTFQRENVRRLPLTTPHVEKTEAGEVERETISQGQSSETQVLGGARRRLSPMQAREVPLALVPPSPPAVEGVDVPPSPPAISEAPPSVPSSAHGPPSVPAETQEGTQVTGSASTAGSASSSTPPASGSVSTGTVKKKVDEDLRPPQIPSF